MRAEKVILSFVAIFVGLIAAGIAFYLYQLTRTIPADLSLNTKNKQHTIATPTPDSSSFLTIDSPHDEEVFDKKLITIRGTTLTGSTVIVSTEDSDEVVTPTKNGSFSLTMTIPNGTSIIEIIAVLPNGEERRAKKTVTYSTESF